MTQGTQSVPTSDFQPFSFKIFQFFFILAILLAPLYLGAVHLWSFSISIFLLTMPLFLYWLSLQTSAKPICPRTDLDIWIVLYILFFFVSALQTMIPYRTWVEGYKLGSIVIVFWATLHYCRSRRDVQRLCLWLALLGGALSIVGLLQYLGGLPSNWWHKPYFLSSVYVNHNHFAGFLEIILPVSLGFALAEGNPAKRILLLFLSALMGMALILTLSRGGVVSMTIALALMLFFLVRQNMVRSSWWTFSIVVMLAAGALSAFGLGPIIERMMSIQLAGM